MRGMTAHGRWSDLDSLHLGRSPQYRYSHGNVSNLRFSNLRSMARLVSGNLNIKISPPTSSMQKHWRAFTASSQWRNRITIIIGLVQRQLELQPIVAVKTHLAMISLLTGFLRHEEREIHGSRAN
jgi:hypothetical protein